MAWLDLCKDELCSKVEHVLKLWHQLLTLSCRMIFESLWPLSTFVHIWTCIYGPCRIYIPNIGHIYMWPYIWNLYVATLDMMQQMSNVFYIGCPNQEIGQPVLFKGLVKIGTGFYFGTC